MNIEQSSKQLNKPMPVARWYDTFARNGINYGPTFQCVSSILASNRDCQAEGLIQLNSTDGKLKESDYLIHPTSLDGVIQLAIIAAHRGRSSDCTSAFLPVSMETLTVYPSGTENASGKAFVRSRLEEEELASDIVLTKLNSGNKFLEVHNLRCRKAEIVTSITSSEIDSPQPFTRVHWRPDIDLLSNSQLVKLFRPRNSSTATAAIKDDSFSLLGQLAVHLIAQFHAKHQNFFVQGATTPGLQRYLNWMSEKIHMMRQNTIPGGLRIFEYSTADRDLEIQRLTSKLLISHRPETRLMCHMYESLPSIYNGEMTGIQAAVQNNLLNDFYEFMTLFHNGTVALKEVVSLISYKNPSLDILEVGGGTGSATREILQALQGDKLCRGYNSYTFTDITPSFLAQAADTFKSYSGVNYAVYDMQVPASEQGFSQTYDLVIASNVVHATSNIRKTLSNIRNLLKPGGKLALFEIIKPTVAWMMLLGTFSDVWKGDHDPEYPRTEGPFLTRAMWNDVLPRCGFTGLDIDLDYFADNGSATVIVATAKDLSSPVNLPSKSLTLVYHKTLSSFVRMFHEYLCSLGYIVELVSLQQPGSLEGKRVLSLVEIDDPLFLNITKEEWSAFKQMILSTSSLLWVTRGNLLKGGDPKYAIISGLVCAVHAEKKSSRFIVVDIEENDCVQQTQFEELVRLEDLANKYSPGDDFEYRSENGIIYASRVLPDEALNHSSASIEQDQTKVSPTKIDTIDSEVPTFQISATNGAKTNAISTSFADDNLASEAGALPKHLGSLSSELVHHPLQVGYLSVNADSLLTLTRMNYHLKKLFSIPITPIY